MVLVYQYWSNKAGSLGHFFLFFFLSCMLLILKYVNLCAASFSVPCMYQFADIGAFERDCEHKIRPAVMFIAIILSYRLLILKHVLFLQRSFYAAWYRCRYWSI